MYIYVFILGKNAALSSLEVFFVLRQMDINFRVVGAGRQVLAVEMKYDLDAEYFQRKLGGTVKIGKVLGDVFKLTSSSLFIFFNKYELGQGKFYFGLSFYDLDSSKKIAANDLKKIGLGLKKLFISQGRSVRWVESRESALSSVIVQNNKLLGKRGIELLIIQEGRKFLIGKTLAVQPYAAYSRRDYGRPRRDSKSGMLPPKLAQVMVNLAGAVRESLPPVNFSLDELAILDPFCGSGTVLQEALLMGYHVLGSDMSDKAVENSKKNIKWLADFYQLSDINYQLKKCDARRLSICWDNEKVDSIVTEPYLGPQDAQDFKNMKKVLDELSALYIDAFREFRKVLKPGGRVVFIFPYFIFGKRKVFVPDSVIRKIVSLGFQVVDVKEIIQKQISQLSHDRGIVMKIYHELSERGTVFYSRQGQRVGREIILFNLKNENA